MKTKIIALAALSLLVTGVALAASSTSSPTCTLTYNGAAIELIRPANINLVWTSNGGTNATLKVDAWSQPNIYTKTALSGNVTVPVFASLGLAATLTVTNLNGSMAVCKVAIPEFSVPKR